MNLNFTILRYFFKWRLIHSCYQIIGPFHFDETFVFEIIIFLEMVNLLKRNNM